MAIAEPFSSAAIICKEPDEDADRGGPKTAAGNIVVSSKPRAPPAT